MSKPTDARLECIDWDEEQPVRVNNKGQGHAIARKVLTKGMKSVIWDGVAEVESLIRQGYEVRLVTPAGVAAVRFYPCALQDMKTMVISSQTMNSFRTAISDKTVRLSHRGHEMSRHAAKQLNEERKARQVAPDMMVTCPKCKARFRVGRKLV